MRDGVTCDVAVIGGGPAGTTAATLLARAGLRVALFEREVFPRLRVGESLLPATLPLLDRLGVGEAVAAWGFLRKYGATFHDEEASLRWRTRVSLAFMFALARVNAGVRRRRGQPVESRLEW